MAPTMARITAVTEGFNGSIGDVQFTDSVAETNDLSVIGYCQGADGYVVEFQPKDAPSGGGPLKGAELDKALDDAGLPKTGTADEKRTRLAEWLEASELDKALGEAGLSTDGTVEEKRARLDDSSKVTDDLL